MNYIVAQEAEALNRVKEAKFALTRLLAEPVGSNINPQRLVVADHSYGANTTMLLAGAQVSSVPYVAKDVVALERWSGQHADIVARFEKAAF